MATGKSSINGDFQLRTSPIGRLSLDDYHLSMTYSNHQPIGTIVIIVIIHDADYQEHHHIITIIHRLFHIITICNPQIISYPQIIHRYILDIPQISPQIFQPDYPDIFDIFSGRSAPGSEGQHWMGVTIPPKPGALGGLGDRCGHLGYNGRFVATIALQIYRVYPIC